MACVPTGERCRRPLGWLSSHAKRIASRRDGLALTPALQTQLDTLAKDLGIPTLQETRT